MQPGLPICILELLATAHKEKINDEDWNFLSDFHPPYKVALLHQWKRGVILFLE
jgi:hypothetical protein